MQHTPTPWKVYRTTDGNSVLGIGDKDGVGITDPRFALWGDPAEAAANAAHIVRCVNAHDALVAVLMKYSHEGHLQSFEDRERFRAEAAAALDVAVTETSASTDNHRGNVTVTHTPMDIVNEQAEDERLWFIPVYATEAILQQALRRLHAAVEGKSPEECAAALAAQP
jgi:hypothetical protein